MLTTATNRSRRLLNGFDGVNAIPKGDKCCQNMKTGRIDIIL